MSCSFHVAEKRARAGALPIVLVNSVTRERVSSNPILAPRRENGAFLLNSAGLWQQLNRVLIQQTDLTQREIGTGRRNEVTVLGALSFAARVTEPCPAAQTLEEQGTKLYLLRSYWGLQ